MSVYSDHRPRAGKDEQGAVHGRQSEPAPLWGLAYGKVEGVVHLTLAFTIVGGAAVILSSALFSPGAPLGGTVEKPAEVAAQASVAPAVPDVGTDAAPAPVSQIQPASPPAPPAPVAQAVAPAPSTDPFLNARPIVDQTGAGPAASALGIEPLAPPSADMREKLVRRSDAAPPAEARAYDASAAPAPVERAAAPATPPEEIASRSAAPKGEAGRSAKCFLKLSGRVQNSGACRVDHAGSAVVFHLPGKTLEISPNNGRVWTASLDGRSLGKVYRNKSAPCWGAKGFYACEKG